MESQQRAIIDSSYSFAKKIRPNKMWGQILYYRVSMEVSIQLVSWLITNFKGLTTYSYRGYNLFTKYHGYPSNILCHSPAHIKQFFQFHHSISTLLWGTANRHVGLHHTVTAQHLQQIHCLPVDEMLRVFFLSGIQNRKTNITYALNNYGLPEA